MGDLADALLRRGPDTLELADDVSADACLADIRAVGNQLGSDAFNIATYQAVAAAVFGGAAASGNIDSSWVIYGSIATLSASVGFTVLALTNITVRFLWIKTASEKAVLAAELKNVRQKAALVRLAILALFTSAPFVITAAAQAIS